MLQLRKYDLEPPETAIQTEAMPKPEPQSESSFPWEIPGVLDTSDVGHGKDRAVLFSGGDDSLALTHLAMENRYADFVIHLATGSSVPENIDYVRSVCNQFNWPFFILRSPMPFDIFSYRYGFVGSGCHSMAYNAFKGRQLAQFYRRRAGGIKLFSGVRRLESDRRMRNIQAEVQYADPEDGKNFRGWWLSPLIDWADDEVHQYREEHNLPRNPVARKIHRSGDCQCLAFGHRDEELAILQAEYPDFAEWLLNVETRTQEYRGRVEILEDQYPTVAQDVQTIRKQTEPHPMRLTVLQEQFPDVFDDIAGIDREVAIATGRLDETNYIGHGGLSSKELRAKVAQGDACQQTLCETCQEPATSIAQSVQRRQQEAEEWIKEETVQQQLPV